MSLALRYCCEWLRTATRYANQDWRACHTVVAFSRLYVFRLSIREAFVTLVPAPDQQTTRHASELEEESDQLTISCLRLHARARILIAFSLATSSNRPCIQSSGRMWYICVGVGVMTCCCWQSSTRLSFVPLSFVNSRRTSESSRLDRFAAPPPPHETHRLVFLQELCRAGARAAEQAASAAASATKAAATRPAAAEAPRTLPPRDPNPRRLCKTRYALRLANHFVSGCEGSCSRIRGCLARRATQGARSRSREPSVMERGRG